MVCEDIELGEPGMGELRIRQTGIGVNYHDVYVRSGLYKTLALPGIPGCEATGVVDAVGPDVSAYAEGDRIAYVTGGYGAYASHRILPAHLAVPVPDEVTNEAAASNLLRAMTVEMLTGPVCNIAPGMNVLVHAAAGGVGRMLCQALSNLGSDCHPEPLGRLKRRTPLRPMAAAILFSTERWISLRRWQKSQLARASKSSTTPLVQIPSPVQLRLSTSAVIWSILANHPVRPTLSPWQRLPPNLWPFPARSCSTICAYQQQYRAMASQALDKFATGQLIAPAPTPIPLAEASKAHDILDER